MTEENKTNKVLMIDDDDLMREMVEAYLEDSGYVVCQAENGRLGIEEFRKQKPDIVLTDLHMPEVDGMEVLRVVSEESPETPVIVISGMGSASDAIGATKAGAWDYILKPIDDMAVLEHTILKALERSELRQQSERYHLRLEDEIKKRTAQLENSLAKLRRAMGATIDAMATAVETRDPYTAGHQKRVTNLARAIARKVGFSPEQIDGVRMAGVIHDLGKISVPAEILSKPTKLSDLEFGIIKTHAQVGYDILKDIEFPWPVAQIVVQHHERIDGSGYPNGLKGDEMLPEARVLTVADVVEAMGTHRPYRPSLGLDVALSQVEENKGTLYDSDIAEACLALFREDHYELS